MQVPQCSPLLIPLPLCPFLFVCVKGCCCVCDCVRVCVCIIRKPKVIILSNWWICLFPRQSSDYSQRATPPTTHTGSPRRRSCSYHTCRDSKRKPRRGWGLYVLYGQCQPDKWQTLRSCNSLYSIVDDSPPYISPPPLLLYPQDTIVWRA